MMKCFLESKMILLTLPGALRSEVFDISMLRPSSKIPEESHSRSLLPWLKYVQICSIYIYMYHYDSLCIYMCAFAFSWAQVTSTLQTNGNVCRHARCIWGWNPWNTIGSTFGFIFQTICLFFKRFLDFWDIGILSASAQGGTCFSRRKFEHSSAFVRVHRRRADIGSVKGSLMPGEELVGFNSIGGHIRHSCGNA